MAIARMRRACLASAVRAASARNCEILRSWRVISIADMLPAPRINDRLHRVICDCLGIPQESGPWAVGMIHPIQLLPGRTLSLLRPADRVLPHGGGKISCWV